jgi:hypothetical protein
MHAKFDLRGLIKLSICALRTNRQQRANRFAVRWHVIKLSIGAQLSICASTVS